MPHVNLFDETYVLPWVPKRARQVLKIQDEDEFYLHDIQCRDPRPVRILSQAQMIEAAILLGMRYLVSDPSLSRLWAMTFIHSLIYMGMPSGSFHCLSLCDLHMSWMDPSADTYSSTLEMLSDAHGGLELQARW